MVKHVVLFQLKADMDAALKEEIMLQFKQAIEALPAKIRFIRHIEVGINRNPSETFDLALVSEFDSMEAVMAYSIHPEHLAAASIIGPYKAARSCVDYEL